MNPPAIKLVGRFLFPDLIFDYVPSPHPQDFILNNNLLHLKVLVRTAKQGHVRVTTMLSCLCQTAFALFSVSFHG